MIWTGLGMSLVAVVGVLVAMLRQRPIDTDALGGVSDHWIAQHRGDAP